MSYSKYQAKLAPGFLQGPKGATWQRSLGAEKDVQLDMNRQAVLADLPGQAPADALDLIGADRDLPRGVGTGAETDGAYAERLRTAWDAPDGHAFRGSHGGLLRALARAGFPVGISIGAVLIQRTKLYSYLSGTFGAYVVNVATHNGWTFNGEPPSNWNQFGLVFGGDVTGLFEDDLSGFHLGSQKANLLNTLVRVWKPAKARYIGAVVVVSGFAWNWPLGVTWGAPGRTWGGVSRFVPPVFISPT